MASVASSSACALTSRPVVVVGSAREVALSMMRAWTVLAAPAACECSGYHPWAAHFACAHFARTACEGRWGCVVAAALGHADELHWLNETKMLRVTSSGCHRFVLEVWPHSLSQQVRRGAQSTAGLLECRSVNWLPCWCRRWSGRGYVCCMRLWFSDSQCIWEKGGCRVMPTQSVIALHASACIGTQRLFHVTGTYLYSVQHVARWSTVCPHNAHCTVGPTISSVIRDLSLDSRIRAARLRRRTQHSGAASPRVTW